MASYTPCPRLGHLTGSNDVPSQEEAFVIQQGLVVAEEHLARIRMAAHELRVSITQLPMQTENIHRACRLVVLLEYARNLQQELYSFIQQHRKILSITRRVPLEIWSEIFTYLSPMLDPCHIDPSSTPWVLGHVCSTWRTVVKNTPAMWTDVFVDLPMYNRSELRSLERRERLKTVIQRSKALPRQLHLESREGVAHSTLDFVAGLLFGEERMIQSLTLRMPFRHFRSIRQHMTRSQFSSLQNLAVYLPDHLPTTDVLQDFTMATRLKSVEMATGFELPGVILPLAQLEMLAVAEATGDDILSIVERCPKMKRMDFVFISKLPANPTIMVQHGSLWSVDLGDVLMLNHLDLPSIIHLSIGHRYHPAIPAADPMRALYDFVRRCGQRLELLELNDVPMAPLGILPVLEQVPHLRRLWITREEATTQDDVIIRSVILSLENASETRPSFLPFLEEFRLQFYSREAPLTIIDHCLVRMLRSRFRRTGWSMPLQSFQLYTENCSSDWNVSNSDIQTLRHMIHKERRNIQIECKGKSSFVESTVDEPLVLACGAWLV